MRRKYFFVGACYLTGALLLPHSPVRPVISGMILAGIIQLAWYWIGQDPR